MNKIILFIAASQDGFIADKNGGVDWLPHPKDDYELEAVGYKVLMQRIDTIVMGRKSFKQIMGFGDWAWADKHSYVFSSKAIKAPLSLIKELKG
jgi:dihydrofolate reductase